MLFVTSIQQKRCIVNSEMEGFGKNLKQERELAGLTQSALARLLGVKQQQVSRWECDKVEPTLYYITRIIRILNIPFEDLVDGLETDITLEKNLDHHWGR